MGRTWRETASLLFCHVFATVGYVTRSVGFGIILSYPELFCFFVASYRVVGFNLGFLFLNVLMFMLEFLSFTGVYATLFIRIGNVAFWLVQNRITQ
jgi:hypothetical protein